MIENRLKEISRRNHHSLYGIYKKLKKNELFPAKLKNIGGVSTNLSKKFQTIREVLFKSDNVNDFLDSIYNFSPKFMKLIEQQIPDCSVRKFGECLGLDTSLDAQAVIDEILRRKEKPLRS
jgi:hypothetical protein